MEEAAVEAPAAAAAAAAAPAAAAVGTAAVRAALWRRGRASIAGAAGRTAALSFLTAIVLATAVVLLPAAPALAGPVTGPAPGVAPGGGAAAGSGGGGAARGPWQWPLEPRPGVARAFAPGPTRYSPGHYGADLAAVEGQQVLAAGAGRVSYAGLLAGRGVVVVVHGATRTTYEPVAAAVAVGQVVGTGTVLGTVTRGHTCPGACLHWGLRRGDDYLDPLLLVRGPVRLLPEGAGGARSGFARGRGPVVAALPLGARSPTGPGPGPVGPRDTNAGPGGPSAAADTSPVRQVRAGGSATSLRKGQTREPEPSGTGAGSAARAPSAALGGLGLLGALVLLAQARRPG